MRRERRDFNPHQSTLSLFKLCQKALSATQMLLRKCCCELTVIVSIAGKKPPSKGQEMVHPILKFIIKLCCRRAVRILLKTLSRRAQIAIENFILAHKESKSNNPINFAPRAPDALTRAGYWGRVCQAWHLTREV